jgi:REP-associated tyrosine transposase
MTKQLKRYYGEGHLHFVTCSCYHRLALLGTARARDVFVDILGEVRERYRSALVGYVVMPEHFHLLLGEPETGTPSTVLQVLKQRVARHLGRQRTAPGEQLVFRSAAARQALPQFWQRRFHDFNVWSHQKKNEKLEYMHWNPVKRGLVSDPGDWRWSSYTFYAGRENALLRMDRVE